jgi:hypothetical protein
MRATTNHTPAQGVGKLVLPRYQRPDRRRHRRFHFDFSVRELFPEQHVYRGVCLSAGGLFCPDAPPRNRGQELFLELDIGEPAPLQLQGRVVESGHGTLGLGISIAFPEPQADVEAFLRKLLTYPGWAAPPRYDY